MNRKGDKKVFGDKLKFKYSNCTDNTGPRVGREKAKNATSYRYIFLYPTVWHMARFPALKSDMEHVELTFHL